MNTQHTPGPWHVESHPYPPARTLIVHEQLGDPQLRTCVAELDASTERDATARLIAAAPDLHRCLYHLEAEVRLAFDTVPPGVDAWLAESRVALEKAAP